MNAAQPTAPPRNISLLDWLAISATERDIEDNRGRTHSYGSGYESYSDSRETARYRFAMAMMDARSRVPSKYLP